MEVLIHLKVLKYKQFKTVIKKKTKACHILVHNTMESFLLSKKKVFMLCFVVLNKYMHIYFFYNKQNIILKRSKNNIIISDNLISIYI